MFAPKAGSRGRQPFLVWANPQDLWLVTNIGESEIAAVRVGSKARGTMPQAQAISPGPNIRHATRRPSVFWLVSFQVWLWSQPMMVRARQASSRREFYAILA
jgi:hypothetical protein